MRKKTQRINEIDVLLESLNGNPLEQARKIAGFNGYSIRVIREDNTDYTVSLDRRFDRINVEIDNGVITSCKIG